MRIIEQLVYKITGDTTSFDKSVLSSQTSVTKFSKIATKALTALSVGAIAKTAKKMLDLAEQAASTLDTIDKMSQKIGISTGAYQEWDFILSQSGASVDGLQTSMKTLSNAASEASDGTAEYADEFNRLNIEVTNADGTLKETETLFNEVFAALSDMDDQTQRTATAAALLGRSATELAPALNQSSEDIEAMREQAHDLGLVLGDEAVEAGVALTDSLDQLRRKFSALKTNAMLPFVSTLNNVIEKILNQETASGELEGAYGNLETAINNYNDVLDNAEGKTDAVTQAMVSQAKAALNLALQKASEAYADSNKEVEKYENNIKSATKWIEKKTKAQEELAEGTGYAADELNRLAPIERSKILLDKKGEDAVIAYSDAYELRRFYTEKQTEAIIALGQAEADEQNFKNTLTQGYLDQNEVALLLLETYPKLKDEVIEASKTYLKKKEAQENFNNANYETIGALKDVIYNIEKNTTEENRNAYTTEYLALAKSKLKELLEEATKSTKEETKSTEEANEQAENREKILNKLTIAEDNISAKEKALGDRYDENSELSSAYLTAIEDLIANGESPQSEKLKELIDLYSKLNPLEEESIETTNNKSEAATNYIDKLNERFKTESEAYKELQSYYQTDKEAFISNLQEQADEWLKAGVDRAEVAKWVSGQLDEYNQKELDGVKELQFAWDELANTGITSLVRGFADIGEALAEGELSWETMASISLSALSDVLNGIGAQLLALGTVDLFNPLKSFGVPYFAGAAAAYLASGTLSGLAASYDVGTMNVPQDMAAQIHAGEIIIPAGIAEEARTSGISIEPNGSSSSTSSTLNIGVYLDSKEIAKTTVEKINLGQAGTINVRVVK